MKIASSHCFATPLIRNDLYDRILAPLRGIESCRNLTDIHPARSVDEHHGEGYREMKLTSAEVCFVATPIGAAASDVRTRSDRVLDQIIRPTVEPLGFKALRLDRLEAPGRLSYQAIALALGSGLMVADLTGANPNVLYEVGIRHAAGKPCVQMIEVGEDIPFDLADIRTVLVDSRSPEGIAAAVDDLSRHVVAAMSSSATSDAARLRDLLDIAVGFWWSDPLHSGPSGVLPAPDLTITELTGKEAATGSGEAEDDRKIKRHFARPVRDSKPMPSISQFKHNFAIALAA